MWIREEASLIKKAKIWVDTGNTRRYIHDVDHLRLEVLYLGLRTRKGISLQDFKNQYHYDLFIEKKKILKRLDEEGFISLQDGYLYATQTGLAVTDSLALI
jgi:coproporphyrinogen III oxidase-like Fe-S oxidoreductase